MEMVFVIVMELVHVIAIIMEVLVQVGFFSSLLDLIYIVECITSSLLSLEYCRASSTCSGNGVCKSDGSCQCNSGFSGSTCSITSE